MKYFVILITILFGGITKDAFGQVDHDYAYVIGQNMVPDQRVIYKKVGDSSLALHIFYPKGWKKGGKFPCFLAIHGGGWSISGPERMYPIVDYLAKAGMVGITMKYRLLKAGSPTTVIDCDRDGRSAVRYIKKFAKELGIDTNKIVIGGGSAGGQISVGTQVFDTIDEPGDEKISTKAAALVLFYTAFDGSAPNFIGRFGPRWKEISPLHQVRKGVCPTLIFHGTADKTALYSSAVGFKEAMLAAGNSCELVAAVDAPHSYTMSTKAHFDNTMEKTVAFLKANKILP